MNAPEAADNGRVGEPEDGRRIGPETPVNSYPGGRLGRFRVVEIVHRGEMGTVVRALDEELGREVALKILPSHLGADPQFQERFVREAQAVAQLDHPAICRIHSVGNQDGLLYVAMQFVHGTTLAEVVRHYRQFTPHGALQVVRTVADALGVVHRAGLVHRDVTSSNIMIEAGGQIRLVDFGLTGFAFNPPSFAPGAYVGTPEYSSPEQCAGGDLDGRADLYSLGVVLYEMLTGRVPFVDEDPVRLFRRLREESPIPIRALIPRTPKGVVALFERMTARDRAERFPDAESVVSEANRLLEATPGPASIVDLVRAEGPRTSRLRWVAAVLVLGTALAVGWGAARKTTPPGPRSTDRPWEPARTAAAPEGPIPPIVAVEGRAAWKAVPLPLVRVGGDAIFSWLGDGIPELLDRSLRTRRGVEAIDRTELLAMAGEAPGKPTTLPPRDIQLWLESSEVTTAMDALGIAVVVCGRYSGDAERVRIEALVRLSPVAASDPSRPVRTVAVQGRPEDILGLVDRLVREVEALLRDRAQLPSGGADAG